MRKAETLRPQAIKHRTFVHIQAMLLETFGQIGHAT